MARKASVDLNSAEYPLCVNVRLRGVARFRARLFLTMLALKVARFFSPVRISVEIDKMPSDFQG